jgi:hypothetical protein
VYVNLTLINWSLYSLAIYQSGGRGVYFARFVQVLRLGGVEKTAHVA